MSLSHLPVLVDSREAQIAELTAQCDKLQAFKDWVHNYLDAHGVPHHPPGTHGAGGCRIGDRLDWLMDKLETCKQALIIVGPETLHP